MISINFKNYRNNYLQKNNSLIEVWNNYNYLIQQGGNISILPNYKRPIFNKLKYYKKIGGGILCASKIVFINTKFKHISQLKDKDKLYIAILFYETANTGVLLYFNIIYDTRINKVIENKDFNMVFKELDKKQIFKVETNSNHDIIYQKVQNWLDKHKKKIIKKIEENINYKEISKCLDRINTRFFKNEIQFKPRELPISEINTINIPSQITSDNCLAPSSISNISTITNKYSTSNSKETGITPDKKVQSHKPHKRQDFLNDKKIITDKWVHDIYPKRIPYQSKDWSENIKYYPPFFTINELDRDNLPTKLDFINHECLLSDRSEESTLNKSREFWADPLDISLIPQTNEDIEKSYPWNKSWCSVNSILKIPIKERKSISGREILFKGLYPLNPNGRTGLSGKGILPRWGPNKTIGILTLFNDSDWRVVLSTDFQIDKHLLLVKNLTPENTDQYLKEIFMNFMDNIDENDLISIVSQDFVDEILEKKETKDMPKLYYQRSRFNTSKALNACKVIELLVNIIFNNSITVKKIYQDIWSSSKNTDNAWIESTVFVIDFSKKIPELTMKQWKVFKRLYLLSIHQNHQLNIYHLEDLRKTDNKSNTICLGKIRDLIGEDYLVKQKKNEVKHLLSKISPDLELNFFGNLREIKNLSKNIREYFSEMEKDKKLLHSKSIKLNNLLTKTINPKIWKNNNNLLKLKTILECNKKNSYFTDKPICVDDRLEILA